MGGPLHAQTRFLLFQIGRQCYVAAALNLLFSVPSVRTTLSEAVASAARDMPDLYRDYITAGVFPASVQLPLGLAVLQLYVHQIQLPEFTVTPVAALIEQRMRGTSERGGWAEEALRVILASLGFTSRIQLYSADSPWVSEPAVDFDILLNFPLHVTVPAKHAGSACVGAFLATEDHVISVLDSDIVFDSNTIHVPPMLSRGWRGRRLDDLLRKYNAHMPGLDVFTEAALVFATRAPVTADRVLGAILQPQIASFNVLGSAEYPLVTVPHLPRPKQHGIYVVRCHPLVQASWWNLGVMTHNAVFDGRALTLEVQWHVPSRTARNAHPDTALLYTSMKTFEVKVRTESGTMDMAHFRARYPRALEFLATLPRNSLHGQDWVGILAEYLPPAVYRSAVRGKDSDD